MKTELLKSKILLFFTIMYFVILSFYAQSNKIFTVPKGQYIFEEDSMKFFQKKYKILVLELESKKELDNVQHNSNPIIILSKNKDNFFKVSQNDKLIFSYNDNCPADGFQGIDVKNNYFTVKQTFCSDWMYVYSYTTFKIDKKSGVIFLYKYGDEYTDRRNPQNKIHPLVWTTSDFGLLKFEEISQDKINFIRQNLPKNK